MRRKLLCGATFIGVAACVVVFAQELAQPTVNLTPKARPPASPSVLPAVPADLPELSQLDEAFKQSSLGKKADEFRLHAEWRRLRNQIANAPDVVAAKKAAQAARTDLEKRDLLRRYYAICYEHMQALAREPDVKAGLDDMKKQHLRKLDQPRVRPSVTPTPTATPSDENAESGASPSATASPSAEEDSETPG